MTNILDKRHISIFLLFAFGIAWAVGLIIYLTGGLVNSPPLFGGLSLAFALLATGYMWAPALAHILTRLVTREGWRGTYLRPHFRQGWPNWLAGWLLPAIATIVGAAVFFVIFPGYFDPSLQTVRDLLARSGATTTIDPWLVVIGQTASGILLAPIINSLFTFGEEFGWRAYLLPRLMPLGGRRAVLVLGIIWGIWHWPVIAMGYEYGFDYAGFPWMGFIVFLWFTILLSIFFGWITLRGGSVWPAVIAHAAVNGIAGLAVLLTKNQPPLLLGPLPIGLIGAAGFFLLALWIFLRPGTLEPVAAVASSTPAARELSTD